MNAILVDSYIFGIYSVVAFEKSKNTVLGICPRTVCCLDIAITVPPYGRGSVILSNRLFF